MAFQPRDSLHRSELELFTKKVAVVMAFAVALTMLWTARDVLILVFIAAVLAAGISGGRPRTGVGPPSVSSQHRVGYKLGVRR